MLLWKHCFLIAATPTVHEAAAKIRIGRINKYEGEVVTNMNLEKFSAYTRIVVEV